MATEDAMIDDEDNEDPKKSVSSIMHNPILTVSTLLDPRMKYCFPTDKDTELAKNHLTTAALDISVRDPVSVSVSAPASQAQPEPPRSSTPDESATAVIMSSSSPAPPSSPISASAGAVASAPSSSSSSHPSASSFFNKRPAPVAVSAARKKQRWTSTLTQGRPANVQARGRYISAAQKKEEIERYLTETEMEADADPWAYWRTKREVYPTLYMLAKKYLPVPATSVYSERLFSEYGNLYEKKRSRLNPLISEKMVFLHHNWPRVDNNGRKPFDAASGSGPATGTAYSITVTLL
jgi:hypothetical protein